MKNYCIIGASSGIGKQLAKQLATAGNHVFGTYHKNEIKEDGVKFSPLDVLQEELSFDFLPEKIEGLAYCPGSIALKPFHRMKPEDFINDYLLQVVGAIRCIQAILPRLKKSGAASIVLFSTVAVQTGMNFHSLVASSKGAIEGFSRSLAAELAPAIRVNCIAPSLTDTPLAAQLLNTSEKKEANAARHPLKKIGRAADIANLAEFLLTDKSQWMTGQVLHIDGGMGALKV